MKKTLLLLVILCFIELNAFAQELRKINFPNISLKNIYGETIFLPDLQNSQTPKVLCFWKSCCPINMEVMEIINEQSELWINETGAKIITVAIDDVRSSSKILPLANGKDWNLEIILDINSDFKRAMAVNSTPHIFVLNSENEIVWQRNTNFNGSETEIYDVLKKLSENEK